MILLIALKDLRERLRDGRLYWAGGIVAVLLLTALAVGYLHQQEARAEQAAAQNTDYGTGFVDYLKPALEKNGAKVVADVTYEADGTGIDSEVTKAVASEPDSIVLIGYPEDGGKVLAELIKQGSGPADVPIYVTDGMQSNELYKAVDEKDPSVTEGIRGTAPSAAPTNGASFFPAAFKEFATDVESPIYSAQSYDCVIIMALAAEKSGSDAPFDIAKELINVTKGETADAEKCDTYAKCVALLKEKTTLTNLSHILHLYRPPPGEWPYLGGNITLTGKFGIAKGCGYTSNVTPTAAGGRRRGHSKRRHHDSRHHRYRCCHCDCLRHRRHLQQHGHQAQSHR